MFTLQLHYPNPEYYMCPNICFPTLEEACQFANERYLDSEVEKEWTYISVIKDDVSVKRIINPKLDASRIKR